MPKASAFISISLLYQTSGGAPLLFAGELYGIIGTSA